MSSSSVSSLTPFASQTSQDGDVTLPDAPKTAFDFLAHPPALFRTRDEFFDQIHRWQETDWLPIPVKESFIQKISPLFDQYVSFLPKESAGDGLNLTTFTTTFTSRASIFFSCCKIEVVFRDTLGRRAESITPRFLPEKLPPAYSFYQLLCISQQQMPVEEFNILLPQAASFLFTTFFAPYFRGAVGWRSCKSPPFLTSLVKKGDRLGQLVLACAKRYLWQNLALAFKHLCYQRAEELLSLFSSRPVVRQKDLEREEVLIALSFLLRESFPKEAPAFPSWEKHVHSLCSRDVLTELEVLFQNPIDGVDERNRVFAQKNICLLLKNDEADISLSE